MDSESHNLFITTLLQTSPVGLLLFLAAILAQSRLVLRVGSTPLRFAALIILLFILLQAMKGSFLGARIFWQPMMLVIMLIETDHKRRVLARFRHGPNRGDADVPGAQGFEKRAVPGLPTS